jgi:hypothetical protein
MMAEVLAIQPSNARNGHRHAVSAISMNFDTYLCPGCGGEVPIGPRGCPKCSKPPKLKKRRSPKQGPAPDKRSSRSDDFDYQDFVAREFGNKPHRRLGIAWYWWVTALVILVLLILEAVNLW